MAITENGPGGHHRGRLGNVVYYDLNGKNVSREIGVTTKPPTVPQLVSRLKTKLCSELLSCLLDFINVGYGAIARTEKDNGFNQASKYNKKNIIKGVYPDLEIAYEALQISKGPLKPAENWQVTRVGVGLHFAWTIDPEMPWPEVTDQVMMLAYFPAKEKVYFNLFGKNRSSGSDVLEIPPSLQGEYMETYMSFITADRSKVADSTYTGSFNKANPENITLIS